MKLTGAQIKILWQATLQAFDRAALKRMVSFEMERNLDDIASAQADNQAAVFELIDEANRGGWIVDLIEAMKISRPGNQQLQAAIDEIHAAQATLAAGLDDPHSVHLIGRHVLMNRDDLRDNMRRLTTAGAFDPRLVVVTGPDASGKSYTRKFINFLSSHFGLPSPIGVALSAWPGSSCSPDELMTSIGSQMGLDTHDLPTDDEAQGARRAIKLRDWLVGKTRSLGDEQWIVLDDLDHPGVPGDTLDLVALLAAAIAENTIPCLRMILLGYERSFPPDVRRDILFEQLSPIDDRAVRLHVREITAQYLDDAQMVVQEGDVIADAALQNLVVPFNREQLATLSSQLERAVEDFLDRI